MQDPLLFPGGAIWRVLLTNDADMGRPPNRYDSVNVSPA